MNVIRVAENWKKFSALKFHLCTGGEAEVRDREIPIDCNLRKHTIIISELNYLETVCKLIKTSLQTSLLPGERLLNPHSLVGKGGRGVRFLGFIGSM